MWGKCTSGNVGCANNCGCGSSLDAEVSVVAELSGGLRN
jgi:hypothetical protein